MDPTSSNSTFNITDDTDNAGGHNSFQVNIFFAIFLPCLIVVTMVMNMATIFAFWKLPILVRKKPSELFFLNLACVDLITGMLLPLGSQLYITPGYWPMGETGCIVTIAALNLSIHGSLFALTTISLDRFLMIYMDYPKYLNTITRGRVVKVIAAGWVLVILTVVIELSLWNLAKDIDESAKRIPFDVVCLSPARRVRSFSVTFFLTLYFCPVMLVCGMSVAFLYQLRKRLQKNIVRRQSTPRGRSFTGQPNRISQIELIPTLSGNLNERSEHGGVENQNNLTTHMSNPDRKGYIKSGTTLVGLVLAMVLCTFPYCFYVVITESGCESCNNTEVLFGLLLLQFGNACFDPFIYIRTHPKVWEFYLLRYNKMKCCKRN